MLQFCRRLSSCVTLCIVVKRCVVEQKLLLTAYMKSHEKSIGAKMNDLDPLFRGRLRSREPLRHIRD